MIPQKNDKINKCLRRYLFFVLILFLALTGLTKDGDNLDYPKMSQPYHPTPSTWKVVWEKTPGNLSFSLLFGLFMLAVTTPLFNDD